MRKIDKREEIFDDPNEKEDKKVNDYEFTKKEVKEISAKSRVHFDKKELRWKLHVFECFPDAKNEEELKFKLIAETKELRALEFLMWTVYFNQQKEFQLAEKYRKLYFTFLHETSMMQEFYNRKEFKINYKTFKNWYAKIIKFSIENEIYEKPKKEKKENNN